MLLTGTGLFAITLLLELALLLPGAFLPLEALLLWAVLPFCALWTLGLFALSIGLLPLDAVLIRLLAVCRLATACGPCLPVRALPVPFLARAAACLAPLPLLPADLPALLPLVSKSGDEAPEASANLVALSRTLILTVYCANGVSYCPLLLYPFSVGGEEREEEKKRLQSTLDSLLDSLLDPL